MDKAMVIAMNIIKIHDLLYGSFLHYFYHGNSYAPINVSPDYPPHGEGWGFGGD